MAYPIHDWRDSKKYPRDPLTGAPAAFIEERKKWGQSKDEMRSALWHWQFLRRYELYQEHWENGSDAYDDAFGIFGVSRPDPKIDFPIDLTFRYEMFSKHSRYMATMDMQKSWEENAVYLKQRYNLLKTLISPFDLAIASLYVPERKLIETRERQLGEKKYPILLRVLDALAAGADLIQIGKEFRPALPENELDRAASRLQKSALDIQTAFTTHE